MIDIYTENLFKKYGPGRGTAVMLGDQRPYDSLGVATNAELMQRLGYDKTIDIDYNGRAALLHNLNYPLPKQYEGIADLLFDGGVLEHVANVGEGIRTVINLMKVGGVVVMNNPCNVYGESYWLFDPLCHRDFFRANGFQELFHTLYWRSNLRLKAINWMVRVAPVFSDRMRLMFKHRAEQGRDGMKRFLFHDNPRHVHTMPFGPKYLKLPFQTCSVYVAIKRKTLPDIVWPTQSMYPTKELLDRGAETGSMLIPSA